MKLNIIIYQFYSDHEDKIATISLCEAGCRLLTKEHRSSVKSRLSLQPPPGAKGSHL